MKFKTIFLSTALLICTAQALAQMTDPVMPTGATQEITTVTASDAIMPNAVPDSIPSASQEPVMPPVSNVIPEQKEPVAPASTSIQQEAQPQAKDKQTVDKLETPSTKIDTEQPKSKQIQKPQQGTLTSSELDFEVENQTGKTIYITCFSYIKKRPFSRWHWNKSPVYKIDDNQTVVVDLPTISDEEDRNNAFGYLGVFDNAQDAENSTIELLDDNKKIDLDIIAQLHGKKVTIDVEKYGIVGEFYDYDFQDINKKKRLKKSLI